MSNIHAKNRQPKSKRLHTPKIEIEGELSILSAGFGDIKLKFNQFDSDERRKAIAMLTEMRGRGYAILVQLGDGSYTRAVDFNAERGEYIIVAPDEPKPDSSSGIPISAVPALVDDVPVESVGVNTKLNDLVDQVLATPKRRGRPNKSIPIAGVKAVAVGRSAGG